MPPRPRKSLDSTRLQNSLRANILNLVSSMISYTFFELLCGPLSITLAVEFSQLFVPVDLEPFASDSMSCRVEGQQ